jgi:hypothetical protein
LDVFFTVKRFSRRDSSQNRHFANGYKRCFAQGVGDFDGAFADAADVALLLQGLQMIGHAVSRGDLKSGADLRDRRRIAFLTNDAQKEVIDLFLPGG